MLRRRRPFSTCRDDAAPRRFVALDVLVRATLGICTIFSITLRVVVFIAAGLLATAKPWLCALAVLPASLTGLWVAGKAYQHLSRDLLLRLIAVMLIGSGVSLIVRGLA